MPSHWKEIRLDGGDVVFALVLKAVFEVVCKARGMEADEEGCMLSTWEEGRMKVNVNEGNASGNRRQTRMENMTGL